MARPAATVDRPRGNIAVGAVIEPNDHFATVLTVNVGPGTAATEAQRHGAACNS